MRVKHKRFWYRYDETQQGEAVDNITEKQGTTYALLLNTGVGGDIFPFARDMGYAHQRMIDSGVPKDNIIILEGDNELHITHNALPATSKNLEDTIESLQSKVTDQDRFIFGFFGHSSLEEPRAWFMLPDPEVYYFDHLNPKSDTSAGKIKDFSKMLRSIEPNYGVFYFSQCYGGAFAEGVGIGNRIGISSSNKRGKGWGLPQEDEGNYFTIPLFKKLFEHGVSIKDAFEYAAAHYVDPLKLLMRRETPQLFWQNADPSKLYLGK